MGGILTDLEDPIVRAYNEFGVTKKMTVEEMLAAPAPTQVSNRTIHDRCLEWGCKVNKTNGNWVWMTSPMAVRFKIRPPQQHQANSKHDIERMLDAIAVPWAVFIAAEILDVKELQRLGEGFKNHGGPTEQPDDEMGPCSVCQEGVIRAVLVKRGKKIAHSYCLAKPQEAQPDPTPPTEEETETVPAPDVLEVIVTDPPEEVEDQVTPRQRYINQVFDLLVERGDPMSNQAVAEAIGITPQQATSAMAALCSQGVVVRVKAGVYQARPDVMRRQSNVGVVISSVEKPFGTIPSGYVVQPTERPGHVTFSQVESVHREPDAEEDETLNEILDLIAPNGFKARHLPLIDAFKRSALALMREVNGGA